MSIYQHLVTTGWMPVRALPETPAPLEAEPDRLAGLLWGVYLGDALGNRCESQVPATRRQRYGEISSFLGRKGRASDDSQLAFWTLEHLLEHDRIVPQKLAARFASEPVRGLGRTVRAFLAGCKDGLPWHECAVDSLGNGSLMRIAPVLTPFLRQPEELFVNVALAAALTHRAAGAVGSCLAFVAMLRQLLECNQAPPPAWYRTFFLAALERCCPDERFLAQVRETVEQACQRSIPVMEMRSGASLLETVPTLLVLLERYGHDATLCVTRAVNDTYDNDSLGSMAAACMGALHGASAFPAAWRDNLEPCVSPLARPAADCIAEAVARWATLQPEWELVRRRLGSLQVAAPITCGALHLVPLLGPDQAVDVDLLEEARRFSLREVGRVDCLQGRNQGRRSVLLLDGEALTGGLQNRMLRTHALIGAGQQIDLPVCCVERGRWGEARAFSASGYLAPPSVRTGRSQVEVWREVEGQLTRTRSKTATRSMQTAYTGLDRLGVEPLRGQVGLLALLGERVLCLEVVSSAALYARLHGKLLAALALESHRVRRRPVTRSRRDLAEEFLERVRSGRAEPRPAAGLGSRLELAGGLLGQALVHQDRLVCLSAFPGEVS